MILECAVFRPAGYVGLSQRSSNRAAVMHTNGFATISLFSAWHKRALAGSTKGSHFQVTNDGTVEQYVDTDFAIGHAFDANAFAVGIETQDDGDCHKEWTDAQITGILAILFELQVPAQILEETSSDGVGWHRQFDAWNHNGHECPCDQRQEQITSVIVPSLAQGSRIKEDEWPFLTM